MRKKKKTSYFCIPNLHSSQGKIVNKQIKYLMQNRVVIHFGTENKVSEKFQRTNPKAFA